MALGFDSEKYLREQSEAILERASHFGDKLYLEFGGKLICDFHAARVLPGFDLVCEGKKIFGTVNPRLRRGGVRGKAGTWRGGRDSSEGLRRSRR